MAVLKLTLSQVFASVLLSPSVRTGGGGVSGGWGRDGDPGTPSALRMQTVLFDLVRGHPCGKTRLVEPAVWPQHCM